MSFICDHVSFCIFNSTLFHWMPKSLSFLSYKFSISQASGRPTLPECVGVHFGHWGNTIYPYISKASISCFECMHKVSKFMTMRVTNFGTLDRKFDDWWCCCYISIAQLKWQMTLSCFKQIRGGSTYGPNRHRPPPPPFADKSCKFSLF